MTCLREGGYVHGGQEGGREGSTTYLALADVVDEGRDDANQVHGILMSEWMDEYVDR